MDTQQDALSEIARIAQRHNLSLKEIAGALEKNTGEKEARNQSIVTRLLAFLGGVFILAGIGAYVSMFWDEMNSAARIIITLGSGIVGYILALIAANDARFIRATTPLFLISALLQPTGMLVTFHEFSTGGDERYAVLFTAAVMLLQQLVTFKKCRRGVLLFVSIFFGLAFFGTALDLLKADEDLIWFVLGASTLCLSYSIDKTAHYNITPFWYFTGTTAIAWSAFELLENSPFEILYLGLAAFLIYFSTVVRSRTVLFVATLSMLGYIGYFTAEHFANSIGWPIALVFIGLVLIGLSAVALRINRKYIQQTGA